MRREGDEDLDVVVFRTLGGAARPSRRRRPKRVAPGDHEPEPVTVTRVTVVGSDGFGDEAEAKAWLESAAGKDDRRREELERALRSVNRAIQAQRICASDPYVGEVGVRQARQIRFGYGSGDELVEGYWRDARALPLPREPRRRQMLAPQQEAAAILSGRSTAYASEDLALRARLDVEQGRPVQAALQLRAAFDAFAAELAQEDDAAAGAQGEYGARAARLAADALRGAADANAVEEAVAELERTLRKRRHRAAGGER